MTAIRSATFAAIGSLIFLAGISTAKDFQQRDTSRSQTIAIISNGIVIASIGRADGLEVSADGTGMITITSGSNSVSVRADCVTLSGVAGLAPVATPEVTVMPDKHGGYTVTLEPSTEFDLGR